MELNTKRFFVVFLVVLVVNLTPALAAELSDVANDAKNFNEQSKKKMGFFAKAKFMVKGYKLINKAEHTSKNPEKVEESLEKKYDALVKKTNNNTDIKLNALVYRNRDNITANTTSVEDIILNVRKKLKENADYVVNALVSQNLNITSVSQWNESNVDTKLNNDIVQIVGEDGYVHYVLIKNVDLKNKTVVYSKDGDVDSIMSLDEFKKSYTGTMLKIQDNSTTPQIVLAELKNLNKNDLNNIESNAKDVKDQAKSKMIKQGIIAGVFILLMIVGLLLALWFSGAATQATDATANAATQVTDTKVGEAIKAPEYVQGRYYTHNDYGTMLYYKEGTSGIYKTYDFSMDSGGRFSILRGALRENYLVELNGIQRVIIDLPVALFTTGAVAPASLVAAGGVAQGGLEVVTAAGAQNWVSVIVKIIGILLIVSGLVGFIVTVYNLVSDGMMWYETRKILKGKIVDYKNLENWYNPTNTTTNTTMPINNTLNIDNQTALTI